MPILTGTRRPVRRSQLVTFTLMLLLCTISISQVGAQVVNNRRLRIDRAIYGMSGKGSDVTNRVRSMVRNDSLDFKVNNTNLGGDPNQGTKKTLKLSYTYTGRQQVRTFNEGDRCRIPYS
jgi:hypothetical protein